MPTDRLVLKLPMSPTANNHYATIVMGEYKSRRIVSRDGKKFRAAVQALVIEHNVPKCNGALHVEGFVFFPTRAGDVDNRIKPTLDALDQAGVFHDDSQVGRVSFARCGWRAAKPGFIIVRISAFVQEEIADLDLFTRSLETGELLTSG